MLIAGIESIKSSQNTPGKTFFGIIRAIELIPYDSAVFVSTGLLPADENLAQYAAMALLKKRIRVDIVHKKYLSRTKLVIFMLQSCLSFSCIYPGWATNL